MAKEWYKQWLDSPFFHKLYVEKERSQAPHFILKLLAHLSPQPGALLLETGCGQGMRSRLLAEQGYEVTGIDLSFDNIRHARQFESDRLHFYQHDVRLPAWISYFDMAFSFFNSFGYYATRREHDDAMRTLANSLKPGGILVFDYFNAHYAEDHLTENETRTMGNTHYEVHRSMDETHFYKRIRISDPSLEAPQEQTEKMAKLSLGDFTDMLSFQNMQVQEVFGDYDLGPYDLRKTERMIVVAKKG